MNIPEVLVEDVEQGGVELVDVVPVLQVAPVRVHDEQGVEERDLGVREAERADLDAQVEDLGHEEAERHGLDGGRVHQVLHVRREHEPVLRVHEHQRVDADDLEGALCHHK